MKLLPQRQNKARQQGIMLVECIIYLGLFFVILMMAYEAYNRVEDTARKIRQSGDDIIASLRVGERWRDDIRAAIDEPTIDHETISIPQTNGAVTYAFRAGTIFRQAQTNAPWAQLLSGVRTSQMEKETGVTVTSWRWELELQTRANTPGIKPLFTFESVPHFQLK